LGGSLGGYVAVSYSPIEIFTGATLTLNGLINALPNLTLVLLGSNVLEEPVGVV
jgi:hypothetical protein